MAAADSIPRKVIEYLRDKLPNEIEDKLHFDAVARTTDDYPVCVVTACPSIPELVSGGANLSRRKLILYVGLIWRLDSNDGRDYEAFQETMDEVVDALMTMHGTDAVGECVLSCAIDEDDSVIELDTKANMYVASVKMKVIFNR